MYNQSFEDLKPKLRDNLRAAKFPLYKIDAFVSNLSMLVPSESQRFDKSFVDIPRALNHLENTHKGMNTEQAIDTLLRNPHMLFEIHDMAYVKDTRTISPTTVREISPYLALQVRRQRSRPGARISQATRDMLTVAPIDRIPHGTPRVRDYGPTEEETSPVITKQREAVVTSIPQTTTQFTNAAENGSVGTQAANSETPKASLKERITPPHEVIAAAAWAYKEKHGKSPQGVSGNEFLPANSRSWSTLTIHHLKGENSLPNLMKRYPPVPKTERPAESEPSQEPGSTADIIMFNPPDAESQETLRASFNPLSSDIIRQEELDVTTLNPHHLAMLAAAKEGCTRGNLLERTNVIYQAAGEKVLGRMFSGNTVTSEEFFQRDKEFNLKLREELLGIVIAESVGYDVALK